MSTIVVTGLPRSGLTLTMQMLHAGGYPCVGVPPAFEEYRMGEVDWDKCDGKAVKLIYEGQLPPPGTCDVIRLRRDPTEQAKSWNKFLKEMEIPAVPVDRLMRRFQYSYRKLDLWASKQRMLMTFDFEFVISEPRRSAIMLHDVVSGIDSLDIEKAASVVIDRSPNCSAELYELRMV